MPHEFYGDGYGRRRLIYHPAHIRRLAAAMLHEANRLRVLNEELVLERETVRAEMRTIRAELHRLRMLDAAQRGDLDPFATVH